MFSPCVEVMVQLWRVEVMAQLWRVAGHLCTVVKQGRRSSLECVLEVYHIALHVIIVHVPLYK